MSTIDAFNLAAFKLAVRHEVKSIVGVSMIIFPVHMILPYLNLFPSEYLISAEVIYWSLFKQLDLQSSSIKIDTNLKLVQWMTDTYIGITATLFMFILKAGRKGSYDSLRDFTRVENQPLIETLIILFSSICLISTFRSVRNFSIWVKQELKRQDLLKNKVNP